MSDTVVLSEPDAQFVLACKGHFFSESFTNDALLALQAVHEVYYVSIKDYPQESRKADIINILSHIIWKYAVIDNSNQFIQLIDRIAVGNPWTKDKDALTRTVYALSSRLQNWAVNPGYNGITYELGERNTKVLDRYKELLEEDSDEQN